MFVADNAIELNANGLPLRFGLVVLTSGMNRYDPSFQFLHECGPASIERNEICFNHLSLSIHI